MRGTYRSVGEQHLLGAATNGHGRWAWSCVLARRGGVVAYECRGLRTRRDSGSVLGGDSCAVLEIAYSPTKHSGCQLRGVPTALGNVSRARGGAVASQAESKERDVQEQRRREGDVSAYSCSRLAAGSRGGEGAKETAAVRRRRLCSGHRARAEVLGAA